MFDLIAGNSKHIPNTPTMSIVATSLIEAALLASIALASVVLLTTAAPEVPSMMVFVARPATPPPPPPPPAAPPASSPRAAQAVVARPNAAPIEAPSAIVPETKIAATAAAEGGVEGGVPGGIAGGVVGGIVTEELPPPPPPPPPAAPPRGPVRIGGQLQAPALIKRVEPLYPPLAVHAHLTGISILEATVNEDGAVVDVKVLRSAGLLLDHEAIEAVKQWRYSPLLLNGKHESFILTVTLSFHLTEPGS